ncbi:universal stress protein [Nocardia gipuzkoensis]|uniref:universal stress protein n=1 Tax=Nocardia gipuzkoensis TaxID=2749991 RepID=UPI00237E58FF|nr:universal stress protein [Nocardia gipuzkoensis]MDE1673888.1 universal stress protein [Nocardia gipuzkoensis]
MSASRPDNQHHLASAAVVVGIDGSEHSDLAVQWAAETAARRGRRLLIAHGLDLAATQAIFGMYDLVVPAVAQRLREEGAARLACAARVAHRVDPELRVDTELSPAHPATLLIERSESAHLVALGAGPGGELAHLGSTLLALTAHGHGEIVVVRDTGNEQRTRTDGPVVVGVDGSPAAEAAVGAAFAEADLRGASLVAVHAASDFTFRSGAGATELLPARDVENAAQLMLAEQLAGWQEKFPQVQVFRKVMFARPRTVLTVWSKSAQLLVVGTRGRGGFRSLVLGSTSNFLVQYAHCPVMVAHEA